MPPKTLTQSDIKKKMPKRNPGSHKGDNGRVLIIGGSKKYYGAPILNAMGALFSGVDLVHLLVPACNFEVSRHFYPDFIVSSLFKDSLTFKDLDTIFTLMGQNDCLLIGSGMVNEGETFSCLQQIIQKATKPIILDAFAISALSSIKKIPDKIIITPHLKELSQLIGKKMTDNLENRIKNSIKIAKEKNVNVLLKGPVDVIVSAEGEVVLNKTGNSGMTVGGSGDVLAGLVASFIVQGCSPFAAAKNAAFILGKAGEKLYHKKSYGYLASDLAKEVPYILKSLL